MKKTIAILGLISCLLSLCFGSVAAEDLPTDKKFGLTGYLMMDTYSSYVDKVSGESLHNGLVMQPRMVVIADPCGFYAAVGLSNKRRCA